MKSAYLPTIPFDIHQWPAVAIQTTRALLPSYSPRSTQFTITDNRTQQAVDITLCSNESGSEAREQSEAFIRFVFAKMHKAELNAFMSELYTVFDLQGTAIAAIGLHHIGTAPIFLEQYLSSPIDQHLSAIVGQAVARNSIVEVGNLACTGLGLSRTLIAFLVYHLSVQDKQYAVCTGTETVRAILKRMGINYTQVERADPNCLGQEQHRWGSYYLHNPIVLAINVAEAYAVLADAYHYSEAR